ncbi:hypothetical protein, partial [Mesorhizobium sp.]|uniref:hypothetical protein n=1 Tax=Mesorhizobium sp. TaxID=1871066 RepID=UPI0025BF3109
VSGKELQPDFPSAAPSEFASPSIMHRLFPMLPHDDKILPGDCQVTSATPKFFVREVFPHGTAIS